MTEKNKIAVVSELPTTTVRVLQDEKEQKYDLVTVDEALTEILTTIRELKENLIGK